MNHHPKIDPVHKGGNIFVAPADYDQQLRGTLQSGTTGCEACAVKGLTNLANAEEPTGQLPNFEAEMEAEEAATTNAVQKKLAEIYQKIEEEIKKQQPSNSHLGTSAEGLWGGSAQAANVTSLITQGVNTIIHAARNNEAPTEIEPYVKERFAPARAAIATIKD